MRNRIAAAVLAAVLVGWNLPATAVPYLSIEVPDHYVGKGEQFVVTIRMNDAEDLFAYQFDFTFDPGLLAVTGVEEGDFLGRGGATIFYPGIVDNDRGMVSFTLGTLTDDLAGVDGTGDLVRIALRAGDTAGLARFALPDIIMLDSALVDIDFAPPLENYVAVVPAPGTLALVLPLLPLLAARAARTRRAASPVNAA
ncbi:cohesin domain-containing protein [Pseudoduganella flava]|nr:cohesin domain-containing protein [Pseudoduganella flava]TWI45339.1 cohesin domain-containing protein [Pseudoduganella flava]